MRKETGSLVSSSMKDLRAFIDEHVRAVVKPLDRMGGHSIFVTHIDDPIRNVILETLTNDGSRFVMAQKYISEASVGDKRILLIDGDPVPYALLRIPPPDDFRGNLSTGAPSTTQVSHSGRVRSKCCCMMRAESRFSCSSLPGRGRLV